MNKKFLLLFFSALLLSSGIVLVLFASIHYSNIYPLLSILVFMVAVFGTVIAGGCQCGQSGMEHLFSEEYEALGPKLSWVIFGTLVVLGYSIPVELFRGHYIPDVAVYMTLSGSTVVLASIFMFVKLIYFVGDSDHAYAF
jgi:hypothetical protein